MEPGNLDTLTLLNGPITFEYVNDEEICTNITEVPNSTEELFNLNTIISAQIPVEFNEKILNDKACTSDDVQDLNSNHKTLSTSSFAVIQDSLNIENTFAPIENNPAAWVVNSDTPQKKSKKRSRKPNKWKREVKKLKRNLGEAYTTVKGIEKPA